MKVPILRNQLANMLSAYRIMSSPALIICLIAGYFELFKLLLAISFFTDAIDGYIARLLKVETAFGARLDSIGDDLTVGIAIFGIATIYPGFLHDQVAGILIVLGLLAIQIGVALAKFRKMTAYHTYLAKLAAVLQAAWILFFLFFEIPIYPLYYVCISVTCLQIAEEILITLLLSEYTVNVKGLYAVLTKKQSAH